MARQTRAKDPETGKFVKETPEDAVSERQKIDDEAASKFLGEEVKGGKVKEDREEPEEEVKEEPKEEPKEEEVVVDPEEMKKDIAERVSKETVDKITKALGGKETTQEQKDKYLEYSEKFAKEKGRNPTWFELVPFIKEEVKAEMKAEEQRVQEEQKAQKQLSEKQNAERQKAFDQYVDEQLKDLEDSGKLKKGDEVSRKALFKTMLEVNQKRVSEGKQPIYSIKEIYYEHYTPPTAQPAGADAPVSVGRGNTQVDTGEEYSYKDIHKPSFVDFFRRK